MATPLMLAHKPRFRCAEQQRCADTAGNAAGVEDGQRVGVGGQRGEAVEDHKAQGASLPPIAIHEAAKEGSHQRVCAEAHQEEARHQVGGGGLPVDHLAHVDVVEVRPLEPVRHLEAPEDRQEAQLQGVHVRRHLALRRRAAGGLVRSSLPRRQLQAEAESGERREEGVEEPLGIQGRCFNHRQAVRRRERCGPEKERRQDAHHHHGGAPR
mmetsp:Transcript_70733/g.188040  ORF Transcript_70733/g.188040 Transcript_70733/m.188040 type:complete len:211 (-) Transcript_70733:95-727(-)